MHQNRWLLFDLDNTIYDVRSIEERTLLPVLDRCFARYDCTPLKLKQIYDDIWCLPFDVVIQIHSFDKKFVRSFENEIARASFRFDINVFDDLNLAELDSYKKVLVTTGFYNLQNAKIDALGIRSFFQEVFIDDPLSPDRIYKKGIFKDIIEKANISPESVVVIGDNPEFELAAARELGLKTVHACRTGQNPTTEWDLCITSYKDLRSHLDDLF